MELKSGNQACSYIIQSQEEEIKRVALELHESINQNLYTLQTGLNFIESGIEQPELKNYAKEMSGLMERTIREVRLLSVELYPNTLSTLGLTAAVKSYAKLFTNTFGILIDVDSQGEEKLVSDPESLAAFRVCQEALINIAKYADTDKAKIAFTWGEFSVKIEIKDTGKGFDTNKVMESGRSMGIAAMGERMRLVGGQCNLTSELDKGTTVSIVLPIQS
ncbi:sensor histidine kinase [Thalassobacillus devorans]|uniref:sensor histidine kinase n=1 Tax=Thalassobacillus devorans TaxID=279813 RepID=UPI000A1C9685|nr:ATP-binding protein [Thalassobacillus devorans]